MGESRVEVKLEQSSLQRVVTLLETENDKLLREISDIRGENRKLRTQITELQTVKGQKLDRQEIRQKEVVLLQKELSERQKDLLQPRISSEEDLEIKVEELEAANREKDIEIHALKCQLVERTKQWGSEIQAKDEQIEKLNYDLVEAMHEMLDARADMEEMEAQIEELEYSVDKKSRSIKTLRSKLATVTHDASEQSVTQDYEAGLGTVTTQEVPGAVVSGTETDIASQQLCPQYRIPDEDYTLKWQLCSCSRDDCPTCVAEKAATGRPPRTCMGRQSHDNKAAKTSDRMYKNDIEDTRSVTVFKETESPTYEDSKKLLYLFHPSVCICEYLVFSDPEGQTSRCSTCSIAALLFAYKYKTKASGLDCKGISDELFSQVLDSINEASEAVSLNFPDRTTQLGIQETLSASSHLGLALREDIEMDSAVTDMLVPYIVHLEPGQILLLYSMRKHYKVLSITASEDNKTVLVFDPQWHWVKARRAWYGALLFSAVRELVVIEDMIHMVQSYCGCLTGTCRLAILEIKPT